MAQEQTPQTQGQDPFMTALLWAGGALAIVAVIALYAMM
jgi:hypothetical protein